MRSETDIEVEVLDFSMLVEGAKDKWQKEHPDKKVGDVIIGGVGLVRTPRGIFLLDAEGIINEKSLEEGAEWEVPVTINEDLGDGSMSMNFPQYNVALNKDNIGKFPVKAEKVNLAKFIRTFGRRLECNFEMANSHLTNQMTNGARVLEETD